MTAPSQHWHSQTYHDNARFVSDYGVGLLEILAPQSGERILDIGCGDGVLTQKIQACGTQVVGIDGSADFVRTAQANGIDARQMDAQAMDFVDAFDAVFSNTALHWMPDAQAVVQGMYRALTAGGRLVAEFGGAGNVAQICQAVAEAAQAEGAVMHNVWYFPSAADYQALLTQCGFQVTFCSTYPRPTPLPTGIRGWLDTFAAPLLPNSTADKRSRILARAAQTLEQRLARDSDNRLLADYIRLRVTALKPADAA